MQKKWMALIVLLAMTTGLYGDMSRPFYTRENRYPQQRDHMEGIWGLEAGAAYTYREFTDEAIASGDFSTVALQMRYRLFRDLTLVAAVPYNMYSPANMDSESDLGDISIGADLVAYQDLFGYPYIIPHITHTFDTGDEEKFQGLGVGESSTKIGVTTGTIVNDVWGVSVDATLDIRSDSDNVWMGSAALARELDKSFSLIGELRVVETERIISDDSYAMYMGVGMTYRPMDALAFGAYGFAAGAGAEEDFIFAFRGTYQF